MRTLIQNLWAVPIFSEEEQARQAQLLHVMRQGLLLVLAAFSAALGFGAVIHKAGEPIR